MRLRLFALLVAAASLGAIAVPAYAQGNHALNPPSGKLEGLASEAVFEGLFSDDDGSIHEVNIEQIAEWGIDPGCGGDRFCPSETVTRAEMAAWLYRAAARLYGKPNISEMQFSDIADDSWYLPYAQWAVLADIMRADDGSFEPDTAVTRADMAEMLVATFHHLATGPIWPDSFSDTVGMPTTAIQAINGIYFAGVTRGCATSHLQYCPTRKITRAQAATLIVRALQAEIPAIGLVQSEPSSAEGYTLITGDIDHKVYLIDHSGDRVHTWTMDDHVTIHQAKLLENGNLMIRRGHASEVDQGGVAEIDRTGRVIWEYSHPGLHHDFALSNGNVLLLYQETRTPEEAIAAGANPDYVSSRGLTYDNVMEVKPVGVGRGDIIWEWSPWDHLIQDHNPNQANYGTIADHPGRIDINSILELQHNRRPGRSHDWTHTNAIDYNPDLDQIMLSPRHFSELWVIDHSITTEEAASEKGDLLYRWGNPQIYQAGTADDQQLFWVHNTHWIPDGLPGGGNILVFNNGSGFRGFRRYYSSVDEITPPRFDGNAYQKGLRSAFGPDLPAWTYTAKNLREFYARFGSGAQRLPNGNTLINDGPKGTVFQVTPDGTTVWKYISPILREGTLLHQGDGIPIFSTEQTPYGYNHQMENWLYLVEWYPPDYPGLQELDLTPKGPIELTREFTR